MMGRQLRCKLRLYESKVAVPIKVPVERNHAFSSFPWPSEACERLDVGEMTVLRSERQLPSPWRGGESLATRVDVLWALEMRYPYLNQDGPAVLNQCSQTCK